MIERLRQLWADYCATVRNWEQSRPGKTRRSRTAVWTFRYLAIPIAVDVLNAISPDFEDLYEELAWELNHRLSNVGRF